MRFLALVVWLSLVAGSALAAETTSFTYDALGRLKSSTVSGGPANGVQSITSFDPAGNRTNVIVTGASSGTPSFSIGSVTEGGVHFRQSTQPVQDSLAASDM